MQIRKEKEVLFLKEQINDDIVQCFEDFEDDVFVVERVGKVRIKLMI